MAGEMDVSNVGLTAFPGLCKLGLWLALPECQHRTQVS